MAAVAWLLYGLARDFGAGPPAARRLFGWALLTAPVSVYGYLLYPVAPAALGMLVGVRSVLRLDAPGRGAGIGLLAGFLPWLHPGFTAPAAVLVAAALWRARHDVARLGLPVIGGVLATGLVWLAGYTAFFQAPLTSGEYAFGFRWRFFATAWLGFIADRHYGILAAAPVFVLAAAACVRIRSSLRTAAVALVAGMPLASALLASCFVDWTGFSATFSRLLAPAAIPLLAAAALAWEHGRRPTRILFTVLAGWGAAVSAAVSILPPLLYEMSSARLFDLLHDWGWPAVWGLLPDLARPAAGPALAHGAAVSALAVGVAWWTARRLARSGEVA